jgi:hypothetical protein
VKIKKPSSIRHPDICRDEVAVETEENNAQFAIVCDLAQELGEFFLDHLDSGRRPSAEVIPNGILRGTEVEMPILVKAASKEVA